MKSNYVIIHFIEDINISDTTESGELVQLVNPIYAGETNIMSYNQYSIFKEKFSNRIIGKIIKQEDLLIILNSLYKQLKQDAYNLFEPSIDTMARLNYIKCKLEQDGVLKPDNDDNYYEDLVNEVLSLQELIRADQRNNRKNAFRRVRIN